MIYKKRLLFLLIFFMLCGMVFANQYYPNGEKDVYIYQSDFGGEVTDEVTAVHGNWKLHTNVGGFGQVYMYTISGSNILRVYSNNVISTLADFDDPVGTKYKIDIGPCNKGVSVIAAKGLVLEVPAGVFRDVIRLDFDMQSGCADAGIMSQWYARDVGIIQWEENSFTGPRQYKLIKATVGGTTYPDDMTAKGLSMVGNLDRYQYWVDMMPPGYRNPVMVFRGALINNTDTDVNLLFPSGQTYDAIVYDEKGNEVTRWSLGMAFIQMIRQVVISPGERLAFQDTLELAYAPDNTPLEPGNYTVELIITSTLQWKTVLNIEVDRAY
jgi:hypothetical protein